MSDSLIIKTFGGFSMTHGDKTISDQDNRSKKLWIILEYLIAFHDRHVPQSTIIDLIWNEESVSADPENALKTALHRIRAMLDELQLSEKKTIIHKQGTFSWNKAIACEFDFEQFVELYNKALSGDKDDDEKINLLMQAFDLYNGEFLPKCSTESWASNLATRYQNIFEKLVNELAQLLIKYDRYSDVTDICGKAASLDPLDENINYYLVMGLFKSGNQPKALEQYKRITDIYYNEFGIESPERFQKLYDEITSHQSGFEADLKSIQNNLYEKNAEKIAYYCDYSVFQHFYKIQARTCERNGMSIFLMLLTVHGKDKLTDNKELIKNAMERLQSVVSSSLRSSDIFSRYSVNQFIAMLPTACYENSLTVGERILKRFDSLRPKMKVNVSFTVKYLEPQMFDEKEEDQVK
ncbi:MAG: hypothetical protein IK071_01470 [Lachnospiraceae bacterium]|nr:hypothetical protein [Lachnospiraceae bacterium]